MLFLRITVLASYATVQCILQHTLGGPIIVPVQFLNISLSLFIHPSLVYTMSAVVKKQGYPTDVKHVAHIGWDSPTGSAATSPSWMNDMKGSPDFSSLNNFGPSTGTS